jgi:hypothetical protein
MGASAASKISIQAPEAVTLGVPFTVKASLPQAAGQAPTLAEVRSSTAAFAVIGVKEQPAGFEVAVLPLDLGKQSLTLAWSFKGPAGATESLDTQVALTVAEPETVKQNPEPMDIKPPWRARRLWWPWLLAAAIVAAAVFLWRARKRRSQSPMGDPAPAVDLRTPEQAAQDELSALESSGLWAEGRHKDFYLRLSEIIRRYLERRRGIAATRLTTTELLRALRAQSDGRQAAALIKESIERGDLVKFAKSPAQSSWGAEDIAAARALLQASAPRDLTDAQART